MPNSSERLRLTCSDPGKAPVLASQSDPFPNHQSVMDSQVRAREEIACILHSDVEDVFEVGDLDSPVYSTGDEMDAQEEGGEATDDANIGQGGSVIRTASPWVRRKRKHT